MNARALRVSMRSGMPGHAEGNQGNGAPANGAIWAVEICGAVNR